MIETNSKPSAIVKNDWKKDKRVWIAGGLLGLAILLPMGKWAMATRQDASDQKAAREVEQQFVERRAAANGTVAPQAMGRAGDGQVGRQGGGQRRGGSPEQREQRRAQRMAEMQKAVGLDDKQMKQIQSVQESSRPMMQNVFRNPSLSREQKMAQMQEMRQAQQAQIAKFLTPDQQAKYTAYQEKMRAERQARRQANGGGGGWQGGERRGGGE